MIAQRERTHPLGGGDQRSRKILPLGDDLLGIRADECSYSHHASLSRVLDGYGKTGKIFAP
jgi:hypothetical protein